MAEIPSGSVIITPDDMWRTIETIRDTGQRTNEAVTELKLIVNPALTNLRDDFKDLDVRVRSLEEQSWASRWVPALVTAVLCSVIAGVIVFVIVNLNK